MHLQYEFRISNGKTDKKYHIFLIPYVIVSKKSHTLKCRTFALWYFLFSKQQPIHLIVNHLSSMSCCCYHKGRNFQANHNSPIRQGNRYIVVVATTKVGIFKQITTRRSISCFVFRLLLLPQRQEFSSKSQLISVTPFFTLSLLLLPQRQEFSSKSQLACALRSLFNGCCCYHKGRNFQANHNQAGQLTPPGLVVVATTKVGIFKQITTPR